ncbi:MAG: bifunctional phosphoglucose/phosphomannose isomerase [Nanoarchaeota archaeon]|nr:bifunctional phosphoglucose/phosphomannose isomerase [Nanoarchaeota archaeon]
MEELNKFPEQIKEAIKLKIKPKHYDKILVCGMGGSGIAGYILRDLLDIPVFIEQSYNIPKFIDKKTLVFVISYSGNTEETISMYKQVKRKTNNIIIITSGGKLGKEKNVIKVPEGLVPRRAIAYLFFTVWGSLGYKGVKLQKVNPLEAKNLAKKIHKKLFLIYISSKYYSIALRWKDQINEDAKHLALINTLPEMDHNEIESDLTNCYPLIIRTKDEHPRLKKKLNLTKNLIKADEFYLKGNTKLEKIFYGIQFGDYLALYLAELYKEDPSKYKYIEKLKRLMK